MSKLKLAILAILAVVLVDFALENGQAVPVLTLFKHPLVTVPTYLLAYISLALGLVIGWSAYALRARRKRRDLAAQAAAALRQRDLIFRRGTPRSSNRRP